ncbi:hypothetical protein D3C77_343870 [compost metagenome]
MLDNGLPTGIYSLFSGVCSITYWQMSSEASAGPYALTILIPGQSANQRATNAGVAASPVISKCCKCSKRSERSSTKSSKTAKYEGTTSSSVT